MKNKATDHNSFNQYFNANKPVLFKGDDFDLEPDSGVTISRGKLKERGWTQGAIDKWLGRPDYFKVGAMFNPDGKTEYYAMSRVHGVESTLEFVEWFDKITENRRIKNAAKKKAQQELQSTLHNIVNEITHKHIESVEIKVPVFSKSELFQRVKNSEYNDQSKHFVQIGSFNTENPGKREVELSIHYLRGTFKKELIAIQKDYDAAASKTPQLRRAVTVNFFKAKFVAKVTKAVYSAYPWMEGLLSSYLFDAIEDRWTFSNGYYGS